MRKRPLGLYLALVLLLVIAAIAAVLIYLHSRAAPEAVRLLPDAQAVIYIDFRPIRKATDFGKVLVEHEPEYEDFVRATGFQFERDLDELAIAVHHSEPLPAAVGQPLQWQRRYSETFVGRFDPQKLSAYLGSLSSAHEDYDGQDIFIIPHEGRQVRVAILSVDTVAVSNTTSADTIHEIVDHYRRSGVPGSGPSLVNSYYRHVPAASVAWAITDLHEPINDHVTVPLPGGINFTLPAGTIVVASVRPTLTLSGPAIQFKAEAFTNNADDAQHLADNANTFLQLFHAVEGSSGARGPDNDVKKFFDSLKIERKDTRAILTADISDQMIKKILNAGPETGVAPAPAQPAQTPAQPDKKAKPPKSRR